MSVRRASTGDVFRPPPADIWNAMIDAGLAYRTQRRSGVGSGPVTIASDMLHLKNNTGSAVSAGKVLQVGTKLPTTVTRESMWFNGETPDPNGSDVFAVTVRDMPSTTLDLCQLTGVAFCRLNVTHVQHHWADPTSSNTLLQTKWHGRARVIWKSTASTGEQDAIVQLGHDFRGPINVVCTNGIAAGSYATCAVWWAGSAASPAATITVYLNWMDGGNNAAVGAEAQCFWHPDQQKYVISNLEC